MPRMIVVGWPVPPKQRLVPLPGPDLPEEEIELSDADIELMDEIEYAIEKMIVALDKGYG